MAEFGVKATELSGPTAAGAQPLPPVQQPAQQFNSDWLGGVRTLAQHLMTTSDPSQEADNFYVKETTNAQQAYDQGAISATQLKLRLNKARSDTLAQFGDKVGHSKLNAMLGKSFNAFKEASGADDALARAKQQTQFEDSVLQEGVKTGIFTADFATDPELREVALSVMGDYSNAVRQAELAEKKLKFTKDSQDMDWNARKRKQEEDDRVRKDNATKLFVTSIGGIQESTSSKLQKLISEVKSGRNAEEAHIEYRNMLQAAQAQALAGMADDPNSQAQARALFGEMEKNGQLLLDPKQLLEYDESRFKHKQVILKEAITQRDPDIATLSAVNGLIGQNALTGVAGTIASQKVVAQLSMVARRGDTNMVLQGDVETQKHVFAGAKAAVTTLKAQGANATPEMLEDTAKLYNATLRDFSRIRANDQVNLSAAVTELASPNMKYMIEKGQIDGNTLREASSVYKSYYERSLMNRAYSTMNQTLNMGSRGGRPEDTATINNHLQFTADANGNIKAIPTFTEKDFKNQPALYFRAVQAVNDLNRQMGDFSTALQMATHLENKTDYQAFFKENAAYLFPTFFPTAEKLAEAKKNGYEYTGGNVNNPNSWRKTGNGTVEGTDK